MGRILLSSIHLLHYMRTQWLSVSLITLGAIWYLAVRFYYWMKPSLPFRIRLELRRWWAKRTRAKCNGEWPILESAGTPPEGWTGWPDQQQFAFVLLHDVEGPRGLARVKQLAELEISMGFRSSFNFIPEGSYRVSDELRHWLMDRGFEVGVHDHRHDGHLYRSRAHFLASATHINRYLKEWNAVGFRSGFMFHKLEWMHDLDVHYDASTFDTDPFEPQPDSARTIFPFWVHGQNGNGYVELPYTLVQDSTLFVMLQEATSDVWRRKVDWIASRGGMALLNVHPDYVAFDSQRPHADEFPVTHYVEFLEWLKRVYQGKYWHTVPRVLASFYRKQMQRMIPGLVVLHSAGILLAV
jgi:hypothetical protein